MTGAGAGGAQQAVLRWLLLLGCFARACVGAAPARAAGAGPELVVEPPPYARYLSARGSALPCGATGRPPPALSWQTHAGQPLTNVPNVRQVHANGTLELLPGAVEEQDELVVRCRAAGSGGVLLSRPVRLQPVEDIPWEAEVSWWGAAGGGAVLRCSARPLRSAAPAQRRLLARLVTVTAWLLDHVPLRLDAPTPDSQFVGAGRWLAARRGAAGGELACVARHAITNATRRSPPVRIPPQYEAATPGAAGLEAGDEDDPLRVPPGATRCLPCAAVGDHTDAHYTWYREDTGRLSVVVPSPDAWLWAGGAALCMRAGAGGVGAWRCEARSPGGVTSRRVRIALDVPLQITVTPARVKARASETVILTCSSNVPEAALWWERDGAPLGAAAPTLELRRLSRAQEGLYQCVAQTDVDSAQAHADVRLAESPPELVYTFIEQALRASGGAGVALRCACRGAPRPALAWLRDGRPLPPGNDPRYSISSTTSVEEGVVTSVLNISAVAPVDGGRYTCRATNTLGSVEHSARLNIYGPPLVRALPPLQVVAGENATLHCPYAGYPISRVEWSRGGSALGAEGRVWARGAALSLTPALPADAGRYRCTARAPPPHADAHQDFELQVLNPPKISPFMFSSELTQGSTVQVLCSVSSGDKPFYFSWFKDGAPLSPDLQIEEKNLNEFSLLMFGSLRARHSGAYTCRVANRAATATYTATLHVKVAPTWTVEPHDTSALLGAPLRVACAATGHPAPAVAWHKHTGGESPAWEPVRGSLAVEAGSLRAAAAARRHAGRYRCSADNGVPPAIAKLVNITVHEPAYFDAAENGAGEASAVSGRDARLSCVARGDEPLALRWLRRDLPLDTASYRWSVTERREAGRGLRSTLVIRSAVPADAGAYRCVAANAHASAERTILLHVEEPPVAPEGLRLGGLGARWVRVRWRGSASDGTHYSAHCDQLPPAGAPLALNLTLDTVGDDRSEGGGSRELAASVRGLRPGVAYALRLAAHNRVGPSPLSAPLLFATLEEAPSMEPRNIRIHATDSDELHISWTAPSSDSWNGELLGYAVTWQEIQRAEGEHEEEAAAGAEMVTEVEAAEDPGRGGTRAAAARGAVDELTLRALRPYSRYAVAVRAFNRAGLGPASPLVHATVVSDGAPTVAPERVRCESVSAFELRVLWDFPVTKDPFLLPGKTSLEYEVLFALLHATHEWAGAGVWRSVAAGGGSCSLHGLRAAANYSVTVRVRSLAGAGPRAPPVICATRDDVGGAVVAVRAAALGGGAVRVSWLAPERARRVTHYTLHARDAGAGREWATRVEPPAAADGAEAGVVLRGLRPHARLELRVRAHTAAGAGPPSNPLLVDTDLKSGALVWSVPRTVVAGAGARVVLPCGAAGSPPLRRRWAPLPPRHRVTDAGDLVILELQADWSGNYTCVALTAAGADSVTHTVRVAQPPPAPAPRLLRPASHALLLAWDPPADPPPDNPDAILGYTVQWEREGPASAGAGGTVRVSAGRTRGWLRGLVCGAHYRVQARAHAALAASPPSAPLRLRTLGHQPLPPPGKDLVWANATALRVNLLVWGGGDDAACRVARWSVALRRAAPQAAWRHLPVTHHCAEAGDLEPGAWFELRVTAHSSVGDTHATYRAATLTADGESVGTPARLEARGAASDGARDGWPLAPALLLPAALAALLLGLLYSLLMRRRAAARARAACPSAAPAPAHSAYSTAPRRGKALPDSPLHDPPYKHELAVEEISPYATFSMGAERWCAEQPCGEPARRPRRPRHCATPGPPDFGESESESSGSGPACGCERAPSPPRPRPRCGATRYKLLLTDTLFI